MVTPDRETEGRVRVGISGWTYAPWRGVFYPEQLKPAEHLRFASRAFSTIELNGSFYSLQRPEDYRNWREATPEDFVFAIKGGRYVTHLKRLREPRAGLANFFASGVLELREKLGPILWQLPASHAFDADRLRHFFDALPRTHAEAARLARDHAPFMKGRVAFGTRKRTPLRHALEFRHPSFVSVEAIELLREYEIAPVVADSAGKFPLVEDLGADFVYVRLHGSEQLYTSGYTPKELREWAARIRRWRVGRAAPVPRLANPSKPSDGRVRDVFVYFDNDVKVRAPFDAMNLTRILNGQGTRKIPALQQLVTEQPRQFWPAWGARE